MSIGSKINEVTTYEVQVIISYLEGSNKLISNNKALDILKMFEPEIISSPSSPNGHFYSSSQGEKFYNHFKKLHENKINKQKLNNYEELKHEAISYCEKHNLLP